MGALLQFKPSPVDYWHLADDRDRQNARFALPDVEGKPSVGLETEVAKSATLGSGFFLF
jgi:hypothetical protein